MDIHTIAAWIGYALMVGLAMIAAAAVLGYGCTYLWRRITRDVPTVKYIHSAVAEYKKSHPPKDWGRDLADD